MAPSDKKAPAPRTKIVAEDREKPMTFPPARGTMKWNIARKPPPRAGARERHPKERKPLP